MAPGATPPPRRTGSRRFAGQKNARPSAANAPAALTKPPESLTMHTDKQPRPTETHTLPGHTLQALRGAPTPRRVAMPPARRAPHETEDVS